MKNLLKKFFVPAAIFAAMLVGGCGGGGGGPTIPPAPKISTVTTPTTAAIWPIGGTAVTSDLDYTKALSWEETKKISVGTILYVRVNRTDSEVQQFPIRFNGCEEVSGEKLVACTALGELVVGAGDSGSPVVTADGRLIAGLCYGVPGDTKTFWARAASDIRMAANEQGNTRSQRSAGRGLVQPVRFIFGLNDTMIARMNRKIPDGFVSMTSRSRMNKSASRQNLAMVPGQSVAINEVSGDLLTAGAIGTYCFSTDGKDFLFAHGYNNYGTIASPVTMVDMKMMVDSTSYGSFKEAIPNGKIVGTAVADRYNGVVVDRHVAPKIFPVDVSVVVNGGNLKKFHHDVTKHAGSWVEKYFTYGAVFVPLDYVLDKIVGGQANGNLKIILGDGSIKNESIVLPDPNQKYPSSDIVMDVSNTVDDILSRDLAPGESPAGVELTIAISDQVKPILSVRLWNGDSSVTPYGDKQTFSLTAGKNYVLQAWVSGWANRQVTWTVDGGEKIATKNEAGISALSYGWDKVKLTVNVTNKDTGVTMSGIYPVNVSSSY